MSTGSADQLDEPPSPGPRPVHGAQAPTVLAADRRRDGDDTPVALDLLAALLSRVLELEGSPPQSEASLTLVDAEQIAELKADHLGGTHAPTDVLSFPIDGVGPEAELIGDVVLCPSVAAAQAPNHTGSLRDELALLVVHGGLHLAGWDHAEPDQQQAMWAREKVLLGELHGPLALDPWGGTA